MSEEAREYYVHSVSRCGEDGTPVDRLVASLTPRRGKPPPAEGYWTVFCGTQPIDSDLTQMMTSLTVPAHQLAVLMMHAGVADPADLKDHRVRVVMSGRLFVRWDGIPAASIIAARRRRLRQDREERGHRDGGEQQGR